MESQPLLLNWASFNIPVHHLDRHMFEAGGKKKDKQEFIAIQKALLAEESWIIEGCSYSTLEMRFARADTNFYLFSFASSSMHMESLKKAMLSRQNLMRYS